MSDASVATAVRMQRRRPSQVPTDLFRSDSREVDAWPPQDQLAGVQRDLQRATADGGVALPTGTRAAMEGAFAADFSAVRVHTGPASDRVASGLGARALTAGRDIVFGPGAFRPHTLGGDRLLAHELAHVVQQAGGLPRAAVDGGTADPLEKAAEAAADQAVTSGRVTGLGPVPSARERDWRVADPVHALPVRAPTAGRQVMLADSGLSPFAGSRRGMSLAGELSHVIQRSPDVAAPKLSQPKTSEAAGQGGNLQKEFEIKLNEWRTHANAGVGEAVHGTLEKRISDATAFNANAWTGGILGNLIWALASFTTGWAAFIFSVSGIVVVEAAGAPQKQPAKTPVADIEEAIQSQLDAAQAGAMAAIKSMSDRFTASGQQLTMSTAMREAFARDQLTDAATPEFNPAGIRASYRKSAEELFATIAAEVDPIGTEIDITGPDPFVKSTTKARLIYLSDLGYAIAHRPRSPRYGEWEFIHLVSPEMVGAAKVKATSSGEGPIPIVDPSVVGGLPKPAIVPLPVPLPPSARLIYIPNLGYAVVQKLNWSFSWSFRRFVPPEETDAAIRQAASSGDGPIEVVDASVVKDLPTPTVVPIPVPPPPQAAAQHK